MRSQRGPAAYCGARQRSTVERTPSPISLAVFVLPRARLHASMLATALPTGIVRSWGADFHTAGS
jgi:hypothetical protein